MIKKIIQLIAGLSIGIAIGFVIASIICETKYIGIVAAVGLVLMILTVGGSCLSIKFLQGAASGENTNSKLAIELRKTALETEGIDALLYLERITLAKIEKLTAEDIALLSKLHYNKKYLQDINPTRSIANKVRENSTKIHDIFVKFGFPTSWKKLCSFYTSCPLEFTQGVDELSAILGYDKGEGYDYIYQVARRMIQ